MTNEERILKRLDALDEKMQFLSGRAESMQDLQETATPIIKDLLHNVLLKEMGEIQEHCELDDLLYLFKRLLLSVRDITWMLEQLENIIELWRTCEPMIKPTFLASIEKFDELDQKGVFASASALGSSLSTITEKYTPEEIGRMGDALVSIAGLLERVGTVNLENSQRVGLLGMVGKLSTPESKQALGILSEILTAIGTEKK